MESLLEAVRACLEQDRDLLLALDDRQYTTPCEACFGSTVGAHIRHNLDHFESFAAGLEGGRVDYEARQRDDRVATDRQAALAALERHLGTLRACGSCDLGSPLQVREESEENAVGDGTWLVSSLGRELQFLLGHTVHHNALVATIVHGMELRLPEGFGVAPSTRRFQRAAPARH